jgi:putative hydrolase of the HAD superfamily
MPIPPFLVLDLDDTILDYSAPGETVWKQLYQDYARRLQVPVDQLGRAVDESRRWYWSDPDRFREGRLNLARARRILVRQAFRALHLTPMETADEMADAFTREREFAVRPFESAIEALKAFQNNHSRMVLLTNGESSMQRAKIERFDLARYFHAILIESETGIGKPDLRAHQAALSALDCPPEEAWMIGDDVELDIRPAKALGMRAAWICDTSKGNGELADFTVPSLRDLVGCWTQSEPGRDRKNEEGQDGK